MLNHIKSTSFMGWAAIFTVLFLTPNTYYVYHSFSVFESPYKEIASIGVALIIAASILIYTLRKNFKVAKYYTLFEVSISAYYYIDTIGWDWGLIPALGFTLILPISVYYYSREFDKSEGGEFDFKNIIAQQNDSYEKIVLQNLSIDMHNGKLIDENAELSNQLSESQTECAHWIEKYQHEVQESATLLGLRDERIAELEILKTEAEERVEYLDSKIDDKDKIVDNQKLKIAHLEKQLGDYYDKYLNVKMRLDKFENLTPSQQAIAALAPKEITVKDLVDSGHLVPAILDKPEKPQAPVKKISRAAGNKRV